ncbi:MFS transporter [Salipaludibacillus aurantiacus]|uniref:Predicted arabinose efflux permease, MFS family n=1 Tax=Salipaludibacillus aurantiacus TaxID=1601833 RepID=A0A1H9XAU0_9BACI|nr:MFS transporter [Salipaludibacillus aurantiacus]SES43242.1 Predicted arabinose efflux permease, MFS family [Salipaludibacillus aurantiacus]
MSTGQINAKKQVIVMAAATAVSLFGDALLYIILPLYWTEMGLHALWQIGVLLSVNRFIRLPLNPLVAWLYKRISYRQGFIWGMVLAAITTFCYGAFHSFWILFIARCLWGLAWTFLKLGAYLAIPAFSDNSNRGYLFGLHKGIHRSGALLGMILGGLAVDQFGIFPVMTVFAAASLFTLPFIFTGLDRKQSSAELITNKETVPFKKVIIQQSVITVLASAMCIAVVYDGILKSTLSYLVNLQIDSELILVGLAVGASTLASSIQSIRILWEPWLSPLLGSFADRTARRAPVFAGLLGGAAVLMVFAPLPMPLFMFITIMLGLQVIGTAMEVIVLSLAADVAQRSSKVHVMTTLSVAQDTGAALGPLIGYMAAEWLGITSLYVFASLLFIILAIKWLKEPAERGFHTEVNKAAPVD